MNPARLKLLTIVGARPQFVKAAALARAVEQYNRTAEPQIADVLLHTGQHYDYEMSTAFFEQLALPEPAYNLEIGSGSHGQQTGQMLAAIESALETEQPDVVLVYGDTNSTIAGALAAAKLHIPVAHVEAGLRSFNRKMPEEVNRIVTDHLSSWLFTPSATADGHLAAEGITDGVHQVGDVMFDILLFVRSRLGDLDGLLGQLGVEDKAFALATVHRAENTDDPDCLRGIFAAFERLEQNGLPVLLPLHPRTRQSLARHGISTGNVKIIKPLGYEASIFLQRHARVLLTDSGGMQKEALWVETPCVTLRRETEWVETLDHGWNVLAGSDPDQIVAAALRPTPAEKPAAPYGQGNAADLIVAELARWRAAQASQPEAAENQ